jgi:hypothetical protein
MAMGRAVQIYYYPPTRMRLEARTVASSTLSPAEELAMNNDHARQNGLMHLSDVVNVEPQIRRRSTTMSNDSSGTDITESQEHAHHWICKHRNTHKPVQN